MTKLCPPREPAAPAPPVLSLKILQPCTRSWDSLKGDDRKRYCDDCNLHVWNTGELTEAQARDLIAAPGRICMTGMCKSDGVLLTKERLREEARRALRRRPLLRIAAALGFISIPAALAACGSGRSAGNVQQPGGQMRPSQQRQVLGSPRYDPPPSQQSGDLPRQAVPGELGPRPDSSQTPPPPPR